MWSRTYNSDGTVDETQACRLDFPDVIDRHADDIPALALDGEVNYSVQANGEVEKVYLLTPNGSEYTKTETTFEALSDLKSGIYYVALEILLEGNCDPDAPQNSYRYEDIFCLTVSGEVNNDASLQAD